MSIQGLSHITFVVRDLDRMTAFLRRGLGAEEVYSGEAPDGGREKFFLLGGIWLAVLEGDKPLERSYRHVALKVASGDLPGFEARLRAIGAEIAPSRPRAAGEHESLYVYDFDNHLFELHTGTLEERLGSR